MKNVVECWKEFFAYFNALETHSVGLSDQEEVEHLRKLGPLLMHLSLLSVNCRYDFLLELVQDLTLG